jgi:tetratricopeptide (TPR) repeat protein/tRNA A-37 threonylcarbamoyl transferase component Bud32
MEPDPNHDPSDESVLEVIERLTGAASRIHLPDGPDDSTPIVKVRPTEEIEARDDQRYQILGEIARGGVGVVFQSRDRDLGRDVALKVLRPELAGHDDVIDRFIEEAQIGGQLQHPGVVPVYGLGLQADGRPYFTMKLVKGRTLAGLLADRENPDEDRPRFLHLFEQLCQAVAYAHDRGVIHRDLKPANVMVGAFGEVQVMDWGFAKVLDADTPEAAAPRAPEQSIIATVRTEEDGTHSILGSVMGTPAYMPPEQALGLVDAMDERADVFSLGAILCEILTSEPPYVGTMTDRLVAASQGRVDGAYERLDVATAGEDLVALAKACLSSTSSERPRDAGVLARTMTERQAAAVERARRAEVEAAEALANAERDRIRAVTERAKAEEERAAEKLERARADWERRARRRVLAAALGFLLAIVLGGGAIYSGWQDRRERSRAADRRIQVAVEEASRLDGERRWTEAALVLEQAVDLAGEHHSGLRDEAEADLEEFRRRVAEAAAALARDRDDAELLAAIEEIRFTDRIDPQSFDANMMTVFRERGVDLSVLDAEAAAAMLRERSNAVLLAHHILDWGLANRSALVEVGSWKKLVEISRLTDPDPARNAVRTAAVDRDVDALRRIAASPEAFELASPVLLTIMREMFVGGDLVNGVAFLRRVQREHPDDIWVNLFLAVFGPISGTMEAADAAPYLEAALALRPRSQGLRMKVGHLYLALAEHETALAHYREALRVEPESADIREHLAGALRMMGRLDESVEEYRRAMPLEPKSPTFFVGYGRTLLDAKKRDEALVVLREGVRRNPEIFTIRMLAMALAEKADTGDMITACRHVLEHDADVPRVRFLLGQFLVRQGETAAGLPHVRRAADELPEHAEAQNTLAWILATAEDESLRDPAAAVKHARIAVRLAAEVGGFWNTLGAALIRAGEPAEAIPALERSLELGGHPPVYDWLLLTMAHARSGDASKAREYYRRAAPDLAKPVLQTPELLRLAAEAKALIGE